MSDQAKLNRDLLAEVARRVRILHENAYIFDGREMSVERGAADAAGRPPIVQKLQDRLYADVYAAPTPVAVGVVYVDDQALQHRFLDELIRANTSRWSWTSDYRIVGVHEGRFQLEAGEREVTVPAHLVDGPDRDGRARLRTEKGSATVQPAWYWAYGEDNMPANAPSVIRVYWNISAEGAVPLMRVLTRGLNEQRVPFQFKLVQDPQRYGRPDAGVLYVPTYAWRRASPVVAVVHEAIARYSRDETPPMARRLGRGLALAEDPRDGASFGMHRMGLLAELLCRASEEGITGDAERVAFIEEQLAQRGYPIGRLHLNPSTTAEPDYPDRMVAVARGA